MNFKFKILPQISLSAFSRSHESTYLLHTKGNGKYLQEDESELLKYCHELQRSIFAWN